MKALNISQSFDRFFCTRSIILVVLLAVNHSTIAANVINDPTPEDFAYGVQIVSDVSDSLRALMLPDHYYQNVARLDGKDLRLFDADGSSLAFITLKNDLTKHKAYQQSLHYFPVYGKEKSDLSSLSLRVERSNDGTIIDINENGKPDPDSKIIAYIIDNSYTLDSKDRGVLVDLEFSWSEPGYGFLEGVKIEKSSDLKSWRPLVSNESLSKLTYEGGVIGKQRIAIHPKTDRFLRISWADNQAFKLSNIIAHYALTEMQRSLRWIMLDAPITEAEAEEDDIEYGAYRFNIKGHIPVQFFSFELGADYGFYRGALYSRANPDARWVHRAQFLQYRLSMSGKIIESESVAVGGVRDSEWLLKFEAPKTLQPGREPVIKIAWYPERLIYLAQGKEPHILAYGNPEVVPADASISSLLNSIDTKQRRAIASNPVKLGEPFELGGVEKLVEGPAPYPWRTILLWAVLIVGVLVMAKMAFSLYRQMDSSDK